jgi:ankyrin repeat protein
VRKILSSGGPLTPRSPNGQTALHVCIGYNDRETAELLLDNSSSIIDMKNMDDLTPIQMAMQKQSWSVASLLVEQGCSTTDFSTFLFKALRQHTGDFSSIRPVIQALAKRFSNKPEKFPLVHLAIQRNNLKCLALLLEGGFDANTPEFETSRIAYLSNLMIIGVAKTIFFRHLSITSRRCSRTGRPRETPTKAWSFGG